MSPLSDTLLERRIREVALANGWKELLELEGGDTVQFQKDYRWIRVGFTSTGLIAGVLADDLELRATSTDKMGKILTKLQTQ